MVKMDLTSEELVLRLLWLSGSRQVCILDSCGPGGSGSGRLLAGISPRFSDRISASGAEEALSRLDEIIESSAACFFSLSYDLGIDLQGLRALRDRSGSQTEPYIFAAGFDALLVHDYSTSKTFLDGAADTVDRTAEALSSSRLLAISDPEPRIWTASSDFTKAQYLTKVEEILELIRSGETYQTNLTQKFRAELAPEDSPQAVFARLRNSHPAEFAAFLDRNGDHVVSISPERFFRIEGRRITASPIKGTRRRDSDPAKDRTLRRDLERSAKDRAENIMITDLLRNDLGRVCDFGSVEVISLCDIEELPSLFHLVSTVEGRLRSDVGLTDVIRSLFPCGSITGCPKLSTMEIIDRIEPSSRGLSMGAIGIAIDTSAFPGLASDTGFISDEGNRYFDLSVAIRTMVIRDRIAEFNAGGGIVIDSSAESEYAESLDKARALLKALGLTAPADAGAAACNG